MIREINLLILLSCLLIKKTLIKKVGKRAQKRRSICSDKKLKVNMTKCGSVSPKNDNMVVQAKSFPHFWAFPLCFTELAQPHRLNLTASLLKNICTYLPVF